MLALCRAPRLADARATACPSIRCSARAADAHAEAAEVEPDELPTGTDGCGVVTFALPLERMAHAFARLESLPGGARIAAAMRAHPDLVGGPDGADFHLMRAAPGWFAKGGAEGLLCAAGPDGIGVALKCEDGAVAPTRACACGVPRPARASTCRGLAVAPVRNTRGERVGECAVA